MHYYVVAINFRGCLMKNLKGIKVALRKIIRRAKSDTSMNLYVLNSGCHSQLERDLITNILATDESSLVIVNKYTGNRQTRLDFIFDYDTPVDEIIQDCSDNSYTTKLLKVLKS
jgi:hypothetical protein